MDGVLLDSEPLHHRALNQILAEEGIDGLSLADYVPYMGTTDEYTWNDLVRRFRLTRPIEDYCGRYDATILEFYRSRSTLAPGAASLLAAVREHGLGLAVASSSRSSWVETCLTTMGIRGQFNIVVSGDMVRRGKPDPEIFLLAARCLGLPPESCLAIEDSPNGIAAAVAAGMFTVAVASPYPTSSNALHAQLQITSLADFDCSLLGKAAAQATIKVRTG
jgi:HAD superfamily hydrolase (TIGR01509 family)